MFALEHWQPGLADGFLTTVALFRDQLRQQKVRLCSSTPLSIEKSHSPPRHRRGDDPRYAIDVSNIEAEPDWSLQVNVQ